mmetsp:Transcript_27069/g.42012  ORF Transcript_27069/g.42012 Transcript_27069/m.42012 type:complete len:481 (+) Transcript_27069:98-1540(+)
MDSSNISFAQMQTSTSTTLTMKKTAVGIAVPGKRIVRRTHSPKNTPNTPLSSPTNVGKKRSMKHQLICSNAAVNSKELANLTRLVPPTLQGVQKAANVLQNGGLLAFPSETVYLVGCDARKEASVESLLKKLDRLKSSESTQSWHSPRYTIHVPSVDEARCHFSFPPTRKYAYRKPLKIRNGNTSNIFTQSGNSSERNDSTDSSSSTNSLASTYCSNTPDSPVSRSSSTSPDPTNEYKLVYCKLSESREVFERLAEAFWPGALTIIAKSTWKSVGQYHKYLFAEGDKKMKSAADDVQQSYYIGVRCPSHPLAQRILKEAGVPVFVSSAYQREKGTAMTQASNVFQEYSVPSSEETNIEDDEQEFSDTEVLSVVNGEDKREIFVVPTCEVGKEATIVRIDEARAHVVILRAGGGPSKEQIKRALYRLPVCAGDVPTSQLITTALLRKKWKVVETLEVISENEQNLNTTVDGCSAKRQKVDK